MVEKLQDHLAYPPRGMRADRAAAYVGMSKSMFLQLVEDGSMPRPKRKRGMTIWDRVELDEAFANLDDDLPRTGKPKNTVHQLLGIKDRDQD
jgi:predicted DNA-binding transcriptional regulator AlpA